MGPKRKAELQKLVADYRALARKLLIRKPGARIEMPDPDEMADALGEALDETGRLYDLIDVFCFGLESRGDAEYTTGPKIAKALRDCVKVWQRET